MKEAGQVSLSKFRDEEIEAYRSGLPKITQTRILECMSKWFSMNSLGASGPPKYYFRREGIG